MVYYNGMPIQHIKNENHLWPLFIDENGELHEWPIGHPPSFLINRDLRLNHSDISMMAYNNNILTRFMAIILIQITTVA